jgi:CubicO group peptidase (beta-lactamase class C family)
MAKWTKSTPDAAGFHPDLQRRLDAAMASGRLGGMHAVAVCRGGRLVAESYRDGEDETIGDTLGPVHFTPDTLHDLRSVTKSIVSLLYGIALEHGLVPGLDTPIVDGFPEYADLVADHDRRAITVGHALSMTMGIAWDESLPYSDPRNSEIAMEHAADRYRFALGQPIVEAPGQHWIYSGGAVALIGALIARGTRMDLVEFAREALFAPLGIAAFGWWRGKDGIPAAASGLRLTTRDLLRIGQVLLDGGRHEGQQVIAADWIETSFQPAVEAWPGTGYGRLWYSNDAKVHALGRSLRTVFGSGYGGQRLYLLPELDLAVVTFSGDYGKPEFWVGTDRAWQEVILGAVAR